MTLLQRKKFQMRVITHDKHTLAWMKNHPVRVLSGVSRLLVVAKRNKIIFFHYKQKNWTTRELHETQMALKVLRERIHQRVLEARRRAAEAAARARQASLMGDLSAWLCIHYKEGSWDSDTGNGYYGGLQMDREFQLTYGRDMINKYGGWANLWSWQDQVIVAERAKEAGRGYWPWPNTAAMCGLI